MFGNSGKDNTQGMLYLSRMDPSRDPKKTRADTSEEQKRRSLAQLGVKEGEDVVAEKEVMSRVWLGISCQASSCKCRAGDEVFFRRG